MVERVMSYYYVIDDKIPDNELRILSTNYVYKDGEEIIVTKFPTQGHLVTLKVNYALPDNNCSYVRISPNTANALHLEGETLLTCYATSGRKE